MLSSRVTLAVVATAALLAMTARPAAAQDVVVQGPGVKLGEATVVRPRVGAEAGVISNVFYESSGGELAPILRLLAGFDLTPSGADRLGKDQVGAPAIDFRAGAELGYTEYLSSDHAISSQRNLDADARAEVTFNPRGKLALELGDRFVRTTRAADFEDAGSLGRNRNHFRAEARWQPGGRMIGVGARYENVIDVFDQGETFFADRMLQLVGLKGNWKFFPYSQVWLDASLGFNGVLGTDDALKVGSNPLRIVTGLDTVLTPPVTLNAYLGYANGFYGGGPSYNTVVGGATIGWRYMPVGRVTAGYRYDVNDSISANYYGEHTVSFGISQQLRRFYASANTGVRFRGYRGVPMTLGPSERNDFVFELSARLEYLMRERFSFYAQGVVQSVSTEYRTDDMTDPSYLRTEVVAGAAAAF